MPLMMARYLGPGFLGIGVTALIAGFMSGMAGNISAFATVWTYDIYRPVFNRAAGDGKCLRIGRWCTVIGLAASIGAAYLVMQFASIMDYVQALFGFFIIPLFGTVILGMLWKRATPAGGFWGLLCGTAIVDPALAVGEIPSRGAGDSGPLRGRQADGREPVPVHLVLAGVRRRDNSGQPGDAAQTGFGTAEPGVRPFADAIRRRRSLVSPAHLRGSAGGRGLRRF